MAAQNTPDSEITSFNDSVSLQSLDKIFRTRRPKTADAGAQRGQKGLVEPNQQYHQLFSICFILRFRHHFVDFAQCLFHFRNQLFKFDVRSVVAPDEHIIGLGPGIVGKNLACRCPQSSFAAVSDVSLADFFGNRITQKTAVFGNFTMRAG